MSDITTPEDTQLSPISKRDITYLSRRKALRLLGVGSAGMMLHHGFLTAEGKTDDLSTRPDANIHGIEIYGLNRAIKSPEELERLTWSYDNSIRWQIPQRAKEKGISIPKARYQEKALLLLEDRRYLQVAVAKSVYDKFQKESAATKIDLPTWFHLHIQEMNKMIKESSKKPMQMILRRIIILDDSKNSEFKERYQTYVPPYTHPLDIDCWWTQWDDLRGNINPHTNQREGGSSYCEEYKWGNTTLLLDYGLIHELFHGLCNLPDEYVQNVHWEKDTKFPDDQKLPEMLLVGDNLGNGLITNNYRRRNPWGGYALDRIRELKIRGYAEDPRSLGYSLATADSETADGIWKQIPKDISLTFKDQYNHPFEGKIDIFTTDNIDGPYYGRKLPHFLESISLKNGQLKMMSNWFGKQTEKYWSVDRLNWVFRISTYMGVFFLHLPVAAFNMTKMAGLDKVEYQIKIHSDLPNIDSDQIIEIARPQDSKSEVVAYASMEITGTNATMLWFLKTEK